MKNTTSQLPGGRNAARSGRNGCNPFKSKKAVPTPGPWFYDTSANEGVGLLIFGKSHRHAPIDHVYKPETGEREPVYESVVLAELDDLPEMEANAAFIVRACNNHDGLMDACKMNLQDAKDALSGEWIPTCEGWQSIIDDLTRVIAKAESR